jgi:hypothetical protein
LRSPRKKAHSLGKRCGTLNEVKGLAATLKKPVTGLVFQSRSSAPEVLLDILGDFATITQ